MHITSEPYGESSLIVTMCLSANDTHQALERPRLDLLRMLHLSDTADWLSDIERFFTDKEILTYFVQKLGEGTALAWAESEGLTLMFTPDILITEEDAPTDIAQLIGQKPNDDDTPNKGTFDDNTSDGDISYENDSSNEVITIRALVYLKPVIDTPEHIVSRGTSADDVRISLGQIHDYLINNDRVPSDLLDKQIDILRDQFNAQLAVENLTLQQYCREQKVKPQVVEEDLHDQATDALTDFLAQDMLCTILGIEFSDTDIQDACTQYTHAQNLDEALQSELYTQLKETHRMYLVENYARQSYIQSLLGKDA